MAKFIRIKNHLINIDKVYDFELCDHTIFVSYSGCESDVCIEFTNKQEAALVFEDIPHLIDNSYIPESVRQDTIARLERENECYRRAIPADVQRFWNDCNYDKLPF